MQPGAVISASSLNDTELVQRFPRGDFPTRQRMFVLAKQGWFEQRHQCLWMPPRAFETQGFLFTPLLGL